ncbi:hypothetical protein [Paraburkholderia strydomiana]|uniref:hypothetical protein n=1 Tax=Paraburkholderia strydomiana TaxID=1245417 RepID=UPI001BEBFF91|nr:hypothetical protein [Paraburkholderia strydomiana]MBT2789178.1 hypothetical protein [Paraburkholderia strydomiana]
MNDVQVSNPFGDAPKPATAALVAAEQSKAIAEVQAALLIARAHPRDPRRAMDRILQDCMRPSLATEATYQYARGGTDITGPSIRLAETLAKRWGNMEAGVKELSRLNGVSECMAYAWDYETNYRDVRTFTVRHWRDTREGGYALKDERDIYELIANNGSRRKRACILALIDGDVVEAALLQCKATQAAEVDVTDELMANMVARFETFGVTKELIERRIQRHLSAVTPAMVVSLRNIYNSLRDGMSAPAEWFDMTANDPAANVAAANDSRTASVKSRMKARRTSRANREAEAANDARASDDAPPDNRESAPTYARIAEAMKGAKTLDALNEAADLIRHLSDETQRNELASLYSTRAADFDERG